MNTAPVLVAKNVTKFYGEFCALADLSLELNQGVNGLVGPNGAGKSTFINIITGMMKPSKGEVTLLGKDPFTDDHALEHIGFLPEAANYPLNMSVISYINHIQHLKGIYDPDINNMLSFLELPKKRRIGSLSTGMYQKLGIILALMDNPRFVILDEPTANLDPLSRRNILDLILDYNQDHNTTFLISTHILPELESIADHLIIINQGKLLTQGNPAELRKNWNKPHEMQVMVDDPTQLMKIIEQEPTIQIIAKFGDHFRLKFLNTETAPSNHLLHFAELVTTHKIEVIEINASSSLEEIFRRMTNHA